MLRPHAFCRTFMRSVQNLYHRLDSRQQLAYGSNVLCPDLSTTFADHASCYLQAGAS